MSEVHPIADVIHADSGPDRIRAGAGDDVVFVNTGGAVAAVDCGPGQDTIYVNPRGLPGGSSNAQALRRGRIRGCERVVEAAPAPDPAKGITRISRSSRGADLSGTERADTLLGGPGPDRISGAAGDDVLWGNHVRAGRSLGVDQIDGGPGADTVYGSRGANAIAGGEGDDHLQGGPGANTIDAGPGNDRVRLRGAGPNRVTAGDGDDLVQAYSRGAATIDCGPGSDTVTIGFNRRVRTVGCEHVTKRYARR